MSMEHIICDLKQRPRYGVTKGSPPLCLALVGCLIIIYSAVDLQFSTK